MKNAPCRTPIVILREKDYANAHHTHRSMAGRLQPDAIQLKAWADTPQIQGQLSIDPDNISGLVITDRFMALATDEGTALQILPNATAFIWRNRPVNSPSPNRPTNSIWKAWPGENPIFTPSAPIPKSARKSNPVPRTKRT